MRKSIKILLIILALLFIGTGISNATITTTSKTINSGDEVTISVTSTESLGAYTVSVTDNGGLTFVTSTGQVGSGKTVISGSSVSGVTSLATFTFKAPEVTEDKTFSVKISGTGMETPDMESVANSSTTAKIMVKAKITPTPKPTSAEPTPKPTTAQKSNNANLKNLVVTPVDFRGFKSSVTSGYTVTVENDITEVGIKATTSDSKATVEIQGNKNLKEGANKVEVVVTAEDGTKKVYTVTVNRKKQETTTPTTTPEPTKADEEQENNKQTENAVDETEVVKNPVLGITSIKLIGLGKDNVTIEPNISPEFKQDVYEYKTTVPVEIENIRVEAKVNVEGATVEVMGNKNLVVGENIITILVKLPNANEQQSYQILVNKTKKSITQENKELEKALIIGASVFILLIAFIIAIRNYKNKKHEKEEKVHNVRSVDMADEILGEEEHSYNEEKNAEQNDEKEQKKKNGKRFK